MLVGNSFGIAVTVYYWGIQAAAIEVLPAVYTRPVIAGYPVSLRLSDFCRSLNKGLLFLASCR